MMEDVGGIFLGGGAGRKTSAGRCVDDVIVSASSSRRFAPPSSGTPLFRHGYQ